MAVAGQPIEAVLTLNATDFHSGLGEAVKDVERFARAIDTLGSSKSAKTLEKLPLIFTEVSNAIQHLDSISNLSQFKKMSDAVNSLSSALKKLSADEINVEQATNIINNIFRSWQGTLNGTEVKVKGVISSLSQLNQKESDSVRWQREKQQALANSRNSYVATEQTLRRMAMAMQEEVKSENQVAVATRQYAEAIEIALPSVRSMITANVELANSERQVANASMQETASVEKDVLAKDKATSSTKRYVTANKTLKNSFSMLKNTITLVGSMIAYNFVHNLAMATTETINAKSEMNGYFQMLGYTTSQTDRFNKALEETVKKFPRLNKYALGETISSIGVEFELTTKEMEKAMPVVSMITSEYLRAGRNVNEASLAVKDILQGEFQRLSRETGVKSEQLKEAGWSGDKSDVMGLLEALEKVGKSRNWDTFVTKANSLNDAVLILQNRFSEWSADMVETVQPTIIGVFNALLDVGGMLSQSLSGIWQWFTGGSIEATITQLSALGVTIGILSQALVMYRAKVGLVEASQLGLTKSITSLIFGLKGQELAEVSVRSAILSKILGLKAETLSQKGLSFAIKENTLQNKLATIEEKINTATLGENSVASKMNAVQQKLNKAETEGLILAKDKESIQEELNTIAKETNTLATVEQDAANKGLIASLYMLGTGEAIVTGETTALSVAWGVLNGVFMLSPIGWITAGILALAGAFYVLTGGLDEHWDKMKQFNETLDNSDEIIQQHNDYLKQLAKTVGEDSQKYRDAKESIEDFNDKLGSSKALVEAYKTEVASIPINLETSVKANLRLEGFSEKDIDDLSKRISSLNEGYNTYYRSLQVIHKQEDDFQKYNRTMINSMDERGASVEEVTEKTDQMSEHWDNFIKHSAEHNTSEDWWSGSWAGFLAWLDSIQIWLDFKTEDLANWWHDFNEEWGKILPEFSKAWESLEFPDVGKMVTDWLSDAQSSLSDTWGYISELFSPIIDNMGQVLSESVKSIPILNSFITLFEVLTDENLGATEIGGRIGDWLGNGLNEAVNRIPILGQVKQLLEAVTGDDSEVTATGEQVGNSLTTGIQTGIEPLDDIINGAFNLDEITNNFTNSTSTITSTATSTASNVATTFSTMKNSQKQSLDSMSNNNKTAFDDMKNKNNTTLLHMRDTTSQVTSNVSKSFSSMKDSILKSSSKIKTDSSNDFSTLGSVIHQFYQNIQNPASWGAISATKSVANAFSRGAGSPRWSRQPRPARVRRALSGAGIDPYSSSSSKKMSIKDLMRVVDVDEKVPIDKFLAMFSGGFGGWDFASNHRNYIRNKAYDWDTAPATVNSIGQVGHGYKVGRWKNGQASFSFGDFQSTAESIFSVVPYKFYYDSEWKGDWVSALMAGAVNCSDGADALIALASLFGFDGYKQHTTLANGVGHFFAVINGKPMDTTAFQKGSGWSPLGGAGIPTRTAYNRGSVGNSTTHNVSITITGDVYGEEDFISKIRDGAREVIREEFNDPLTGVM